MSKQSKITAGAMRLTLFFYLLSASAGAVAGSVILGQQTAPVDSVMAGAVESAALPQAGAFSSSTVTPTVALLEKVRQNGRQQAAEAAFSLAVVAIEKKDFAAAGLLIQEALQLQPSDPGYLQVAASLAIQKGDLAEAEAYQVKTLEVAQAVLGTEDIRISLLMDDLGTIYLAQGHYEQAERTWRKSIAIREQILGNMDPSLAPRLKDLAGVVLQEGRFDETEQLLKRLVNILEADTVPDRTNIAAAQHILADFYVSRERMDEANELYHIVLADWKTAPAPQRLRIAANVYELGNEYLSQLRLEEAKPQFELVLGLLEEDFGADHLYVRGARKALDKLNSAQEKHSGNKTFDRVGDGKTYRQLSQRNLIM